MTYLLWWHAHSGATSASHSCNHSASFPLPHSPPLVSVTYSFFFYLLPYNGRLLVCVHDSLAKRESVVRSTANTLQSESVSFFLNENTESWISQLMGRKSTLWKLKEREKENWRERGLGAETMHVNASHLRFFSFRICILMCVEVFAFCWMDQWEWG